MVLGFVGTCGYMEDWEEESLCSRDVYLLLFLIHTFPVDFFLTIVTKHLREIKRKDLISYMVSQV